jgi:hypothetical protein
MPDDLLIEIFSLHDELTQNEPSRDSFWFSFLLLKPVGGEKEEEERVMMMMFSLEKAFFELPPSVHRASDTASHATRNRFDIPCLFVD